MLSIHEGCWRHTQINLGRGVEQVVSPHGKVHSCWRKVLCKKKWSNSLSSPLSKECPETFGASLCTSPYEENAELVSFFSELGQIEGLADNNIVSICGMMLMMWRKICCILCWKQLLQSVLGDDTKEVHAIKIWYMISLAIWCPESDENRTCWTPIRRVTQSDGDVKFSPLP